MSDAMSLRLLRVGVTGSMRIFADAAYILGADCSSSPVTSTTAMVAARDQPSPFVKRDPEATQVEVGHTHRPTGIEPPRAWQPRLGGCMLNLTFVGHRVPLRTTLH